MQESRIVAMAILPSSAEVCIDEQAAQVTEVITDPADLTAAVAVGALRHIPASPEGQRRLAPEQYPDTPFYSAVIPPELIPLIQQQFPDR